MSRDPTVTILVPVFQGEGYLVEALDSILAQSYARCEVVVLDDASTDRTPEILASYADRVSIHRNAENLGQFHNVNAGIQRAGGDLIAVYHADDIYSPSIVEREVATFERYPELGAVFAMDLLVDERGQPYAELELPPDLAGGRPLPFSVVLDSVLSRKNRHLIGPTSMVRREVYAEVGGYRQELFGTGADLDMWLRIARSHPIAIVEEHLIAYRHFHGSESQSYRALRVVPEDHFAILDRLLDEGARAVASRPALTAHEAHRSEDWLMIAIHRYIMRDCDGALDALRKCRVPALWRSPRVQWVRLICLWLVLQGLTRLPHLEAFGSAFRRRWGVLRKPTPIANAMPWSEAMSAR